MCYSRLKPFGLEDIAVEITICKTKETTNGHTWLKIVSDVDAD